jgi:hypothetical protein
MTVVGRNLWSFRWWVRIDSELSGVAIRIHRCNVYERVNLFLVLS